MTSATTAVTVIAVKRVKKAGLALGLALALVCMAGSAAERLPGQGADIAQTSVSGVSSGAYMAVQFHVAHSATVRGAGIIAGGPYYCAENNAQQAARNCMKPDVSHPVPDPAHLKSITDALARSGGVDDPVHLRDSRIWLFSGKADPIVKPPVMEALARYYALYLDQGNIAYKNDMDAGHAMVTEAYGQGCSYTGPPFIDDCDYDAAGALLAQIHGPLNPPSSAPPDGRFVEFDQNEFLPDGNAHAHSLSDAGFAYVPAACAAKPCRVHIALHGCLQNAGAVGDAFYRHAGYNRWADSNALIVLYPQTITRYGWGRPFWNLNVVWNPNGCWDWWGYDSDAYHTRNGPQIQALWGMLNRLAEARHP